ncbi:hypothetical protein GCM10009555_091850 [Acrocarpospora macrocephala]|uniref:Restriction endonuclease type IV Mrr domain-containing protein n=1 Tax=Acrocarpospora macrocephala TaxID=150177 RepID=A0A5M3X840_9ACTN|nr:hypothetical protein [Acrocarpospora macrocephala]GES16816.1 hypothetical protein Amac_104140 [Acrocarpospora macrocephala]
MRAQGNPALTWHGRDVTSVFDLLGRSENDLTAALAFALTRSPDFLHRLMKRLLPMAGRDVAAVRLETRDTGGRTDLEIDCGSDLVIIEAKRGWLLPSESQLGAYAPRVHKRGGGVLVSLSDTSLEWSARVLPSTIDEVPVVHLPWDLIRDDLVRQPVRPEITEVIVQRS